MRVRAHTGIESRCMLSVVAIGNTITVSMLNNCHMWREIAIVRADMGDRDRPTPMGPWKVALVFTTDVMWAHTICMCPYTPMQALANGIIIRLMVQNVVGYGTTHPHYIPSTVAQSVWPTQAGKSIISSPAAEACAQLIY